MSWSAAAAVTSALALALLIVAPVGAIFLASIYEDGLTIRPYADFLGDRRLLGATLNSLTVAAGIAVLSVLIGAPLAFGVARTPMRFKRLVRATMILALISP
jgi:iron(III) transport system permease protein